MLRVPTPIIKAMRLHVVTVAPSIPPLGSCWQVTVFPRTSTTKVLLQDEHSAIRFSFSIEALSGATVPGIAGQSSTSIGKRWALIVRGTHWHLVRQVPPLFS